MRPLLVLTVLLALAAPARADVFAPADPTPPGDAYCIDGDGDVIAALRRVREGWVTEVSVGGGPWERVLGAPVRGEGGCPSVAAAADGTAVVAGGSPIARIAIRRPGGGWGAPSVLGQSRYGVALAAASGGAVVAAWTREASTSLNSALSTLVMAPGGAVSKRVLARGQGVSPPRVAIAPDGTTTVAWSQAIPFYARRYAELRAGRWSEPVELPNGGGVSNASDAGLALAATPSGRRLIAWVADDGVRAQLDGEPSTLLVPGQGFSSVAAAVGEDGTAVVAYADSENRLLAVDHAPAWSAPRMVSADGSANVRFEGGLDSARFAASIAPNGVPVVAWPLGERVAAVVGRARPALLSPPTRATYDLFDLSGDRLLWVEPNGTIEPGPLRGARLAAAGAPVDTTPPRVTLRIPRRVPSTKTARFAIPVTASCDEVCDVRVDLLSGDHTVERLEPGRRGTVRHPSHVPSARLGVHREPFIVTVSDRAGNTISRRASLRVRVVDAPVRSFKVGLDHDFGMVDAAGNGAVARFVNGLIDRLARGAFRTRRAYDRAFAAGFERVARRHTEVRDIEVRDTIDEVIYVVTVRAGL